MAAPMAPVTSWCGGTVTGFPVTFSKAETTDLFAATPPWKKMRSPTFLPATTLFR